MRFDDRREAGRQLAAALGHLRAANPVVLGLPRGGIPVAFEVARHLRAPLDVTVVRKLGVPHRPELAFGAIGEDGARVINDDVVRDARMSDDERAAVETRERAELERRVSRYRATGSRIPVAGRTAVVVDDGLATGASAAAACQVVRAQGPSRVVLAVPLGPLETVAALRFTVDELVCLHTARDFDGVGAWYHDFTQTGDDEVASLLARARRPMVTGAEPVPSPRPQASPSNREVTFDAGGVRLAGRLTVPEHAAAAVAFVHGSGSSRHSPRNRYVAAALNRAGLATLLFDLLAPAEEGRRSAVFDIRLLSGRLVQATAWLHRQTGLPIGYFGASTGAAAALTAAAGPGGRSFAIVSRGGRPDLAPAPLAAVRAPTLLIVGSRDTAVLALNQQAAARMRCEHRVAVVPRAGHLFEEPGALTAVSGLARDWFTSHLTTAQPRPPDDGHRPLPPPHAQQREREAASVDPSAPRDAVRGVPRLTS
ncbi:phosphoribosyltransferase family protein [Actinomycetota bacterium Odt1-20B]